MTKKTVIIRTALNSTFNYRISVCELLQTDDSITSINSAITTLRATITQRDAVSLVTACHHRSCIKFTEMCQKLAL